MNCIVCTVLLYVGSETAWHCLYCKMQRKKLGWARVCVTVWECVDRLSEKSSNYDELAGYWFLDEFLSCLASIMSVIHAAPHGTPRTGPGGGCEKVSNTKKCSPTLLSRNSLCENSTLSAKAQFCQNTQNIPPAVVSCSSGSVFSVHVHTHQPPHAEETPVLIWTSDEIDHPHYPINTWDEICGCGTVQYPVHTGLHSTSTPNDAWIIIWDGFKLKRSHILNAPFRKSYVYHILSSYL